MSQNTTQLQAIIQNLKSFKSISQKQIKLIIQKAKQIFLTQSNVQYVPAPVTICGDIHGQLHDLIQLFTIGGFPPYTNYLFLGDYVDRGNYSVQTFCLLISLKVRYPNRITMTRGNHQTRRITQVYGFYQQCNKKYGSQDVWKELTDLFDYIPLTALVENQIFCMHGGWSPDCKSIDSVRDLPRVQEIPENGLASDLLWSDPDQITGYKESTRGAGYVFGQDVTEKFNRANGLKLIARAHQLMMKGYLIQHNNKIATIFSAPNYCYRCNNQAAFLQIDEHMNESYLQFDPYPKRGEQNIVKKTPDYFL